MATPSFTDDSSSRLTAIYNNLTNHYEQNPNDPRFSSYDAFKKYYSFDQRSSAQQSQLRNWFENNIKWGSTWSSTSSSTSTTTTTTAPKVNYTWNSLTEYLKAAWWTDTSLNARRSLANQLWIKNYSWTAAQNTQILNALKNWSLSVWSNWHVYWDSSVPTNAWPWVNQWTNLNEPISYTNQWDYTTDDPNRLQEIRNNIEKWYVNTNPELFQNRQKFDNFFHYNERWEAQKALLDELFEKYNQSDATPYETTVLEQEKDFEETKRDDKLATLQDIIDKLNARWDWIEATINWRLKEARDNLDNIANTYMWKLREIQDLYDEYFPKVKQAMQEKMAWEMAWLTSEMSAKKMSWLLRNSLYWIQQNYNKLFNNLASEQAELLKALNDWYWSFMLQLQQEKDNLDQNEYDMLVNWYNNFKATLDALSAAQQQSIDEINRAWENWYQARTNATAEEAWINAKKQSKNAAYKSMDFYSRAQYLTDNLVKIIWDWTTLDNYNYNVIKYAAENFNDLTEALNYIAQNAKYQNKSWSSSSATTPSWVDSWFWSAWKNAFNWSDYTWSWNAIMG